MKLYAIAIGQKHRNIRYVSLCPFNEKPLILSEQPLAVYDQYSKARKARQRILKDCGHKAVYIIRFIPG